MVRDAFREFRTNLRQRGFYRRPTRRILAELLLSGSAAIGGIALFLMTSSWIVRICALVVSAIGSIAVGTNTHTSSHYATSELRWVNELLTYLGFPLGHGLSATYWWHKHVMIHHSRPNVIDFDNDASMMPWFATTTDEVKHSSGARRIYYEHVQRFVFPFAVSLTFVSQQIVGLIHLIASLRDPKLRRPAHWIDAGALLAHAVIVFVIPMFLFPALQVFAFYFVRQMLISYGMFAVFAPAHIPPEAVRFCKDLDLKDFPLAVTETTLNYRTGRLGKMICSGLEYQIEHHLMPDINHIYLPEVSVLFEAFCRMHALPYRRYGFLASMRKSLDVIRNPVKIVTRSEGLIEPCSSTYEGMGKAVHVGDSSKIQTDVTEIVAPK